ncbi:MAG: O-antigen ligase family protein [Propylenella sp.]
MPAGYRRLELFGVDSAPLLGMAAGAMGFSLLVLIHPPTGLLLGILLCTGLPLLYLTSRDALFPTLATLLFLPFHNSPVLNPNIMGIQGMKPFNLLAVTAIAAAFLWLLTHRQARVSRKAVFIGFTIYFSVWTLTSIRSLPNYQVIRHALSEENRGLADYILSFYIRPSLLAFMFIAVLLLARSPRSIAKVLLAISISIFVMSLAIFLIVIEQGAFGQSRDVIRAFFRIYLGLQYNTLGTIYILTTPILLYRALQPGIFEKFNYFFSLTALLIIGSRSALLVCAATNLAALLVLRRPGLALTMSLAVGAVVLLAIGPTASALRSIGLEPGSGLSFDAVISNRVTIFWEPLLQEWAQQPWKFWFGAGRYGILTSQLSLAGALMGVEHAHNGIVDFFLDSGLILTIVLVVCLISALAWCWRVGCRLRDPMFWCLSLSLFGYLLASLTERGFYPNYDNAYVFPIFAVLVNLAWLRRDDT